MDSKAKRPSILARRCSSRAASMDGMMDSPIRSAKARKGRPSKGSKAAAAAVAVEGVGCGVYSGLAWALGVGMFKLAPTWSLKLCGG